MKDKHKFFPSGKLLTLVQAAEEDIFDRNGFRKWIRKYAASEEHNFNTEKVLTETDGWPLLYTVKFIFLDKKKGMWTFGTG